MIFIWTEERMNFLRENAGKLRSEEIALALGTTTTVVRNRAARAKLSLRVRGYTPEQMEQVRALYASGKKHSIRNISMLTGVNYSAVVYIIYAGKRGTLLPHIRRERLIEFWTEDKHRHSVQEELVDMRRTHYEKLKKGSSTDIWLLDGSHFSAKDIIWVELIVSPAVKRRLIA